MPTIFSSSVAINAELGVLLADLSTPHLCQSLNGREAAVLSERNGDSVESVCERSHGILLDSRDLNCIVNFCGDEGRCTNLISCLRNCQSAANVCRSSPINDPIINDDVTNCTDGIMQSTLCLIDDLADV
jgi:hypothetical protein